LAEVKILLKATLRHAYPVIAGLCSPRDGDVGIAGLLRPAMPIGFAAVRSRRGEELHYSLMAGPSAMPTTEKTFGTKSAPSNLPVAYEYC
jgi:hypothetical protein